MNNLLLKLTFAKDRDSREWATLDPRVRAMTWEVIYLVQRHGYAVVVTSTYRADSPIHAARAAVDLDFVPRRVNELYDTYRVGRIAECYINRTWKYGRSWLGSHKPAAIWHRGQANPSGDGWHLHVQAPPGRTMRALP